MSSAGAAGVALDLTWPALQHHTSMMACRIRADGVPEVIVGVLRGGMVPAVMLAHLLSVRDVRGVEVTRTLSDTPNGAKAAIPQTTNPASLGAITGADVLLVDDVAGFGDTVEHAARLLADAGRLRRAVIVVNTINWSAAHGDSLAPEHVQDYVGCLCAGWVRFPWEVR